MFHSNPCLVVTVDALLVRIVRLGINHLISNLKKEDPLPKSFVTSYPPPHFDIVKIYLLVKGLNPPSPTQFSFVKCKQKTKNHLLVVISQSSNRQV